METPLFTARLSFFMFFTPHRIQISHYFFDFSRLLARERLRHKNLGSTRRINLKTGEQCCPEAPSPQTPSVFLVPGFIHIHNILLRQHALQGLVGLRAALTFWITLASWPREIGRCNTSRQNLRIVENEQWHGPLRYAIHAVRRGPTKPLT
jgi:hypothetical protein